MESIAINIPDPEIAAYYPTFRRNRHVVEGARKVIAHATEYLPMVSGQTKEDYAAYVSRVTFYPAAARAHQGILGLMFRRNATIKCPKSAKDIFETITAQGFTIDDLAEEVAGEVLTTNFCALVVDHPITPKGLSKAEAIKLGYRPFVALYRAESILGIETAVVNNRQRVVRVRLLDDTDTVRELRLDSGVYSITIHRNNGGAWSADEPIIPVKKGKPLDEIPFTLVSTGRRFLPAKAPIEDVASLNIQHFLASANLATCHYFSCSPIYTISGAALTDSKGDPITYSIAPGTIWLFGPSDGGNKAEAKLLEFTGATIDSLRDAVKDIKDQMADVSLRILATEKAAAEAAETLAIRRASENAVQASFSRMISRKITDALKWVASWMDLNEDEMAYELNTDFNAIPLGSQDITTRMSLWQVGAISLDAFLDMMIANDVLPETFDRELDRQKAAEEIADRPTLELPRPEDDDDDEEPIDA